jgi:hypothetical protein
VMSVRAYGARLRRRVLRMGPVVERQREGRLRGRDKASREGSTGSILSRQLSKDASAPGEERADPR